MNDTIPIFTTAKQLCTFTQNANNDVTIKCNGDILLGEEIVAKWEPEPKAIVVIIKCDDSSNWYSKYVGKRMRLIRISNDFYIVRFRNKVDIVHKFDAEIINNN